MLAGAPSIVTPGTGALTSIVFSALAPLLVVAVTVTLPPAGTSSGAVNLPSDVIAPALADQVTVGESFVTLAVSWTEAPVAMLAGTPSIVTLGTGALTSIVFSALAPLLVVAVTVTVPPAGTSSGAVN